MCEVTVNINEEGHIGTIQAQYCDNHPACCTLTGKLVRPMVQVTTSTSLAQRASSMFPTRGASAPSRSSSSTRTASGEESQGNKESPPRRTASNPASHMFGLSRLTGNAGDKQRPVQLARDFCIMLCFVYRCGHEVQIKPTIRGWVCIKEGCKHNRASHIISVPLQFPCSWVEKCDSNKVMRKALLTEVVREKKFPTHVRI